MRKPHWIGLGVVVVLLAAVAYPVYAHCGKCAGDAKEYLKAMQDGKTTLASAIAAAEATGKGTAVAAYPHKHDNGAFHIHVYTVAGDKMTLVMVDTKDNKVVKSEDASSMEGSGHKHEHKEGDKKKP